MLCRLKQAARMQVVGVDSSASKTLNARQECMGASQLLRRGGDQAVGGGWASDWNEAYKKLTVVHGAFSVAPK